MNDSANEFLSNLDKAEAYEAGYKEGCHLLRDQFAMAALTGLIAACDKFSGVKTDEDGAEKAYEIADACMKERAK